MADALLDQIREAVDGPIDFHGQYLAEQCTTAALSALGLVSFIVGYVTQNITYTLWSALGGIAILFLAIVPPWPIFNQHSVIWLPAKSGTSNIHIVDYSER